MAYVYRHIRLDKNQPFYIGVGGLDKFDNYYRSTAKFHRNIHWKRIVAKTDYEVEILLDNLTKEEALAKEIEFITLYGRKDGYLCNLTNGGDGVTGYFHSNETKVKIGKKSVGRKIPKSQEWRDNLSKIAKANSWGGAKKPIIQLTKSGEFIKEWNSITEAANSGFSLSAIIDVCKNKPHRKTHKGYAWKYKEM